MRRAGKAALALVTVASICAVLISFSTGDTSERWSYTSDRYGFSVWIPPGWQRAEKRLVPKLLLPREILTVGTARMLVGGGGNCGREPMAAISRMRPGDALISIQEYAVSTRMRSRLGTASAPPSRLASVRGLKLRREQRWPRERSGAEEKLWSTTLAFADRGRWFDALVYVRGRPTAARMSEVREVLDHLRFEAGKFVARPAR